MKIEKTYQIIDSTGRTIFKNKDRDLVKTRLLYLRKTYDFAYEIEVCGEVQKK